MKRVSYPHHKHVSQSLNESAVGDPEEDEEEGEEEEDDDDGKQREGNDNGGEEEEEENGGVSVDNASSVERCEIRKVKNGKISTGNVYRRSRLLKDSLFDYFEETTTNAYSIRGRSVSLILYSPRYGKLAI